MRQFIWRITVRAWGGRRLRLRRAISGGQGEFTLDVHRMPDYVVGQMIQSYRDKRTREFANGRRVKELEGFRRQAEKHLDILDAATSLVDLQALPSNALGGLKGERKGQFSIRINMQWRICFEWPKGQSGPSNVEIVDYH